MSLGRLEPSNSPACAKLKLCWNPQQSSSLSPHEITWETDMLKGGLLWLIGIPLPIILILFFMGWLS